MAARYSTTFLWDLEQFLSADEVAETRQRVIELDPRWLPVVIMVRPIEGESLDTKDDVREWLNGQIQLGLLEVYDEISIEFRSGARNIGIADQEFGNGRAWVIYGVVAKIRQGDDNSGQSKHETFIRKGLIAAHQAGASGTDASWHQPDSPRGIRKAKYVVHGQARQKHQHQIWVNTDLGSLRAELLRNFNGMDMLAEGVFSYATKTQAKGCWLLCWDARKLLDIARHSSFDPGYFMVLNKESDSSTYGYKCDFLFETIARHRAGNRNIAGDGIDYKHQFLVGGLTFDAAAMYQRKIIDLVRTNVKIQDETTARFQSDEYLKSKMFPVYGQRGKIVGMRIHPTSAQESMYLRDGIDGWYPGGARLKGALYCFVPTCDRRCCMPSSNICFKCRTVCGSEYKNCKKARACSECGDAHPAAACDKVREPEMRRRFENEVCLNCNCKDHITRECHHFSFGGTEVYLPNSFLKSCRAGMVSVDSISSQRSLTEPTVLSKDDGAQPQRNVRQDESAVMKTGQEQLKKMIEHEIQQLELTRRAELSSLESAFKASEREFRKEVTDKMSAMEQKVDAAVDKNAVMDGKMDLLLAHFNISAPTDQPTGHLAGAPQQQDLQSSNQRMPQYQIPRPHLGGSPMASFPPPHPAFQPPFQPHFSQPQFQQQSFQPVQVDMLAVQRRVEAKWQAWHEANGRLPAWLNLHPNQQQAHLGELGHRFQMESYHEELQRQPPGMSTATALDQMEQTVNPPGVETARAKSPDTIRSDLTERVSSYRDKMLKNQLIEIRESTTEERRVRRIMEARLNESCERRIGGGERTSIAAFESSDGTINRASCEETFEGIELDRRYREEFVASGDSDAVDQDLKALDFEARAEMLSKLQLKRACQAVWGSSDSMHHAAAGRSIQELYIATQSSETDYSALKTALSGLIGEMRAISRPESTSGRKHQQSPASSAPHTPSASPARVKKKVTMSPQAGAASKKK